MPVLDDRIWSHPKWASLTSHAFRAGITAICYSHEFGLRGRLTADMLITIGVTDDVRDELVTRHIWEVAKDGNGIAIHDWADYNDDNAIERRRELGRARTRRWRERNAPRDVTRNGASDDRVTLSPQLEEEEEEELPLTPRSGDVDNELLDDLTPRASGKNPRALGTNPRAVAEREKTAERENFLALCLATINEMPPSGTDVVHDRLDELERQHHAVLSNGERTKLVDLWLGGQ